MIKDFLDVFSNVRSKQHFYADDKIDKLNRSITVIFLIISSILIGARQLVGPAIVCLDDGHRLNPMTLDYATQVCWAKNTYHLADMNNGDSKKSDITYYQWLPFILIFLAFCFYIPYFIWKLLLRSSNLFYTYVPLDISGIINLLKETKVYKTKEFNAAIQQTTEYLNHCFIHNSKEYREAIMHNGYLDYDVETGVVNLIKANESSYRKNNSNSILNNRGTGGTGRSKCNLGGSACCMRPLDGLYKRHMFIKYFCIKLIYLINSVAVFWFLHLFLNMEPGFHKFGIVFMQSLLSTNQTSFTFNSWDSRHFPRIVFCDLSIKGDNFNTQNLRFQCSLPANVFNEKVFMFLWFWFAIVMIMNALSLVKWLMLTFSRYNTIQKYLNLSIFNYINSSGAANGCGNGTLNTNKSAFDNRRLYRCFLSNYLQFDGYFLLLILKENLNDLYVRRLVENLYKSYMICNLDDEDIMTPTKSTFSTTSTAKVPRSNLNSSSPTTCIGGGVGVGGNSNIYHANRKYLIDQELSSAKGLLDKNNNNNKQASTAYSRTVGVGDYHKEDLV